MPGKKYNQSLAQACPEITAEWAYDLNQPGVPEEFAPRSGKAVHWRCREGHTWRATIAQRTAAKSGCPYCSGRRCLPENSLATLEPDIAELWDQGSNGDLTPSDVSPGSGRRVHWQCRHGHQWQKSVQAVVKTRGHCSKCNSLAFRHPEVASQWDHERNPDTPWDVAGNSNKKRYWRCEKDSSHSWEAVVASRTGQGTGCPQCANLAVSETNNLQYLAPGLIGEYDLAANGAPPNSVIATSAKKVWWVCPQAPAEHRWQASPLNRYVNGQGCPYCAGKLPSVTNSLASLHPEIAAQFDSEANGIGPDQVVAGSNRRYRWRCPAGLDHEWTATPANRTGKGQGCPCCAGRQASVTNSLQSLHPHLARELDPELNRGTTAGEVVAGSNRRLTWRCSVNPEHVWEATPNHRTSAASPTGCPYCSGLRVLPGDSLAWVRPDIAIEWDMAGNGSRRPDQVAPGSDYRASWICPLGHRWRARVDHRTRYGVGCGHAECNLAPRSAPEIFLAFELARFFEINLEDRSIEGPDGTVLNVDIKIPQERVVVEFDGAYWHRGQEDRDSRKSRKLQDAGWRVVRVRDHDLEPIAPWDVPVDTHAMSHKEIANRTLERVYELLGRDKAQLEDYLALPDLVRQSEAAAYVQWFRERKRQRAKGGR